MPNDSTATKAALAPTPTPAPTSTPASWNAVATVSATIGGTSMNFVADTAGDSISLVPPTGSNAISFTATQLTTFVGNIFNDTQIPAVPAFGGLNGTGVTFNISELEITLAGAVTLDVGATFSGTSPLNTLIPGLAITAVGVEFTRTPPAGK